MEQQEILLSGGKTNASCIFRVGDTIRRPVHQNSLFVREFLQYLEAVHFDASPRFLGIDAQGREIITYIEGDVPANFGWYADKQLIAAAKLIRRFHNLTVGCKLAGDVEIICHNDLSPCNFVFINNMPKAIIDFEMAAPGTRIFDLAYAAWLWLDIGNNVSVSEQKRRLLVFSKAYGEVDILLLVKVMMQRQSMLVDEGIARQKQCMAKWAKSGLDWTVANLVDS